MEGTQSRKIMSNTLIILKYIHLNGKNCELDAHAQCARVLYFSPYSMPPMYMLTFLK